MAQSIPAAAYRNRHEFDDETESTWQAEVGMFLDDGVTPVAVGNVSVGDEHTTTSGSFGYRNRFTFQIE